MRSVQLSERLQNVLVRGPNAEVDLDKLPADLTSLIDHEDGGMRDRPLPRLVRVEQSVAIDDRVIGIPEGVITATRPDGGYWAQRVRDGHTEGWLRIGDATYAMRATENLGDARLPMLELYSGKTGLPMDRAVGGPDPLRDWEVFLWTPR